jgi:hypothetical protein
MSLLGHWQWLLRLFFVEFGGGGGGGGSTQFKAQGSPPGFDYQNAAALNQLAIGGDIQSYALSDAAFANQYPALQNAYNQWQGNLGQQVNQVGAGGGGQAGIMAGLANQIAGRYGSPTTTDINAIRNAASTAGGAIQPIFNLGGQQAAAAQPIFNLGAQQAGLANPIIGMGGQIGGIGNQINQASRGLYGAAQIPYQLGQQLLQEPIDPQTQQQMMLAGLGSAAGALGGASLGRGMAGQSAAARQLGLNTLQYGQAMRGEGMGDIGQYASMLGQGGQLQGLGAQTIGLGGQTMGLGGNQLAGAGQQFGLGANVLGQGAQTYGLGAQTAATSGQLSSAAQQAQEQYGMDTANMANIYGTLQNQQAMNLMTNMQTAGNMFQKRPFGMGGTNLAQTELGQAGAYNSFQQANFATMNGIAFNQAQLATQQQQIAAQQNAAATGAAVSIGSTAAVVAATAACWVARAVYGTRDKRWKIFRHWLMNKAPHILRRLYLRFGQSLAPRIERSRCLRFGLKLLMNQVIERTVYVQYGA